MKVVIVGSRTLVMPGLDISSTISSILATVPETGEIAVRGPRFGKVLTSIVEQQVEELARRGGRHVVIYRPLSGHGHAAVFERDYTLVDQASKVYAFFTPGSEMAGGTGHVVKAALDREVPVEAYTVDDDGHLQYVGSMDGRPGPLSPDELEQLYMQVNG